MVFVNVVNVAVSLMKVRGRIVGLYQPVANDGVVNKNHVL